MDNDDQCFIPGDPLVIWSSSASTEEEKQHISMPLLRKPSKDLVESHWDLCLLEIEEVFRPFAVQYAELQKRRPSVLIDKEERGNQWSCRYHARTTMLFDRDSVWVVTQTMVSIGSAQRLLGDRRLLCLDFSIYPGYWGLPSPTAVVSTGFQVWVILANG
jgi:hypothetical protein